jgi:23S rRNA (guanine2445-N2)-methyltransferase / 23S rRNA (guanine2069-N7)-methyltransferase
LPAAPAPIRARDVSAPAIEAARQNAAAAGVAADVTLEVASVDRPLGPSGEPAGTFCTNPPYGERMGADDRELQPVYEALAGLFSRHPAWRAAVLSGNPLFSRVYLRRPDITHRLWNGPLETRLLVYQPRPAGQPTRR